MNTKLSAIIAVGSLLVAACSQPSNDATTVDAEPAPVPVNDPADPAGFVLDDGSKAFLAMLSPEELGMARLSCIRPLMSGKVTTSLFDPELAAQVKNAPDISQTDIILSVDGMTIPKAREIMDASPWFDLAGPAPTTEQVTALRQCVGIVHHYAAEKAGG